MTDIITLKTVSTYFSVKFVSSNLAYRLRRKLTISTHRRKYSFNSHFVPQMVRPLHRKYIYCTTFKFRQTSKRIIIAIVWLDFKMFYVSLTETFSRDSNLWSDVSSIGPSVSASGSVTGGGEEIEAAGYKKARVYF